MPIHFHGKLVDIHAHILPGVDDGARTMEESLSLIKMSMEAGFGSIVVTPHYSRRHDLTEVKKGIAELNAKICEFYPEFQLYSGQEIMYHEGLIEELNKGAILTIAESRYVLIEFSNGVGLKTILLAVRRLNDAGYIPILAHVERYKCLKDKKNLEEVGRCGCLLQMNYDSISGYWFQQEVHRCRKMVKDGWIHLFGTDMHRKDFRSPRPQKALKWLSKHVSTERFEELTCKNAKNVIENKGLGWIKNE